MYTIKSLRVSKAINPYVERKWLLQCASMSTDCPTRWEKLEVILVTWNGLFTIIPPKKVGPSSGAAMFRVSRARRLSHTLAETRTTLLTEMRWHLPSTSRWLILLMRTERSSGFWTPVRPWPWKAIVFFVFRDFECTWAKVKKIKAIYACDRNSICTRIPSRCQRQHFGLKFYSHRHNDAETVVMFLSPML